MKKLLVIILLAGVFTTAKAQFHGGGHFGGGVYYAPSFSGGYYNYGGVGLGLGLGLGYYGYPYYAYPYYGYAAPYHPSKLDQQIADINHDYEQKIESARMDNTISGKERREQIRALKEERDHAIDQAKRDYYKN